MPLWASKRTPKKVAQFDALNWRKRCYGAGGGGDSWSMIDVKVNLLRQQHQQHKHTFFFAEESRWSTESMKKKQQHFCTSAILCRSGLHRCENTHTQQTICVCVNHMEPALAAINARWAIVWYAVIGIGGDWSCSGSACCITSCTHTAEPGEKCAGMIIRRVSADRSIDKVSSRQVRKVCTTSTVRAILATHFTVSGSQLDFYVSLQSTFNTPVHLMRRHQMKRNIFLWTGFTVNASDPVDNVN